MRRHLLWMTILYFTGSMLVEANESDSCAALKAEYAAAKKRWIAEYQAAKHQADGIGRSKDTPAAFDKPFPSAAYSARFLAIAERNPDRPDAIEAIGMALRTSWDGQRPLETRARAIRFLRDHYRASPRINEGGMLRGLGSYAEAQGLLEEVAAQNPDRFCRAAACREIVTVHEFLASQSENLRTDDSARKRLEASSGKDFVAKKIEDGTNSRHKAEKFRKILRQEYSDIIADLSIDSSMPALVSEDLQCNAVTLADLKGKVVVLDIWTTACVPCRQMIPHERAMVARLKDKPFALISISFDAEKKTLLDFLAKEPMPWTHWWNGAEGKLIDTLNIQHYPTIFVLDPNGVIRYKEIRGEALEKAVNTLLEDAKDNAACRGKRDRSDIGNMGQRKAGQVRYWQYGKTVLLKRSYSGAAS
jgi:thiol-disulfide isomerase/thioredoxin